MTMENQQNLDEFAAILASKGYTDSFLTNAAYPDSLRKSITRYLLACKEGQDQLTDNLSLQCYLKYSGDDRPFVECSMKVLYEKEKFGVTELKISKYHAPGILAREAVMMIASMGGLPDKAKAIAMVDTPLFSKKPGPRMK